MNKLLLATMLLSTQGACATLFSGTTQSLAVHSNPPGAGVFVDDTYYGDTPLNVRIERSFNDHNLTLKKDGYADLHTQLVSRFNPVALINLVEPVGWVVDAISGAMMKYDNSVNLQLPVAAPAAALSSAAPSATSTVKSPAKARSVTARSSHSPAEAVATRR